MCKEIFERKTVLATQSTITSKSWDQSHQRVVTQVGYVNIDAVNSRKKNAKVDIKVPWIPSPGLSRTIGLLLWHRLFCNECPAK